MYDNRKISLCITTYNRVEMTLRAFAQVVDDPRIREVVILDDGSKEELSKELKTKVRTFDKVLFYGQHDNEGVYKAKKTAIMLAYSDWCILLDSDNVIGPDYLDTLYGIKEWDKTTSYLPSFARETFDYRHFAGQTITKENVASFMGENMFDCLINTMNGFYNRMEYQLAYNSEVEPLTADSMYMNYQLLTNDNKLFVVPGLEYIHTVHEQSHYKLYSHKNEAFKEHLLNRFKMLPNGILH